MTKLMEASSFRLLNESQRYALYAEAVRAARSAIAPRDTDLAKAEHAEYVADKIGALGDYAKEAAALLRQWAREIRSGAAAPGAQLVTRVQLKLRPLLVSGMLAADDHGPAILIDSEQGPREQAIALWHETLHLLGIEDEAVAEEYALRLQAAAPDILRRLAHVINVPRT